MCEKGVNKDQMKLMVAQVDDSLAMAQQWLEQIHHLADHGGLHTESVNVAQASVLLGEARAKLDSAIGALDGNSTDEGVTVELV
ncbi:MAG: dynein gamma chain protein [Actinobacteria bacterium]|nr:dynein gamma chain protein [Actinomycetota bacterium]MCG2807827.1 dynein gamma chain protein [Coriobacteriia bacterium]